MIFFFGGGGCMRCRFSRSIELFLSVCVRAHPYISSWADQAGWLHQVYDVLLFASITRWWTTYRVFICLFWQKRLHVRLSWDTRFQLKFKTWHTNEKVRSVEEWKKNNRIERNFRSGSLKLQICEKTYLFSWCALVYLCFIEFSRKLEGANVILRNKTTYIGNTAGRGGLSWKESA